MSEIIITSCHHYSVPDVTFTSVPCSSIYGITSDRPTSDTMILLQIQRTVSEHTPQPQQ